MLPRRSHSRRQDASSNDHIVEIPLSQTRTNVSRFVGDDQRPVLEREVTEEKMTGLDRPLGGRRKRMGERKEEELNVIGKFYYKVYNASIVTRYFIYLVPLSLVLAVPTIIGAVMDKETKERNKIGGVYMVWFFMWFQIIWLSLWVSKLVAKALPYVFQALMGVVSSGVKKYATIIRALELPISLVLWAVATLVSFQPLMRGATAWKGRVDMNLRAALVCSVIFLAEKFFVQLVSVNYHRKQFEGRIKETKRNVRLVSHLYDISRRLFPSFCEEFKEEDYMIHQGIAAEVFGGKSGAATPMRQFVGNLNTVGDKLTSAIGNVAREVAGKKNVFNPTSAYSIVSEALSRKTGAEALARRIWLSFVPEGCEALTKLDLIEVMGEENEQDALDCFSAIDADDNGDVSLSEMTMFTLQLRNDRKAIKKSMEDVDNAIGVLDKVLSSIVFIVVIFVFVAFNFTNFSTMLAAAGTVLLSLSFVFSISAQEVLGSCIFLFVKHPFDVGDRVDINGKRMVVEHISLLYSVFKQVENSKVTQIPNNVLNTQWIENISRSKFMQERLSINVHYDTSWEDLQLLKGELAKFVAENNRDFQKDFDIEVIGINELDRLEIKIEIKHKTNWANEQLTMARRNKFFMALVEAMKKVPIYGPGKGDPGLGEIGKPSFTVAVTEEFARAEMEKAAAAKEAKRWAAQIKEKEAKKAEEESGKLPVPQTDYLSSVPLTQSTPLSPIAGSPSESKSPLSTDTLSPVAYSTAAQLYPTPSNASTGRRRPGQGLHDLYLTSTRGSHSSVASPTRDGGRPSTGGSEGFAYAHEMQRVPASAGPGPATGQGHGHGQGSTHPSQAGTSTAYRPGGQ